MSFVSLSDAADTLEQQTKALRAEASAVRTAELKAKPVADRIVYAARSRCACGAGMAYDPTAEDAEPVFVDTYAGYWYAGYWDCSAIILGTQDDSLTHTAKLPFAFYNLKSEGQASANGDTTRPK